MEDQAKKMEALLSLSHELGREDRRMAILGEGNTSVRMDAETFRVKASGGNLGLLKIDETVCCRFDRLLPLLDAEGLSDAEIDQALFDSRVESAAKKPSVEALFHAWLLSLPGMEYVGHTHALSVNKILCSPRARDFAEKRLFPDQVVCCGEASVFVPYADPGLKLAQAIRRETTIFIEKHDQAPRVILLENHGIITLGAGAGAVLGAMLMAEKAAEIFLGAAQLGGPVFMAPEQVERIAGRPDEHYRRKALHL